MKDFNLKERFLDEWDTYLRDELVYDFNPTNIIDNVKEDPQYEKYKNHGWFANFNRNLGLKQLYYCKGNFQACITAIDVVDSFYCRFTCSENYKPHFFEIASSCGYSIHLATALMDSWKIDGILKLVSIREVVQLIGDGLIPVIGYYDRRDRAFSFEFFINCFKSKPTSTVFEKVISNLNDQLIKKQASFNPKIKEKEYTATNFPVIEDLSFYRAPRMIKLEKVHDRSVGVILRTYNGKMTPCIITLGMNFAAIIHEHLHGEYRVIVSETMLAEMGMKLDTLDTAKKIPQIKILQTLINRSDFFNQFINFYGKTEPAPELTMSA